ncbi:MAG TPA: 23S rRNA (guanosine(2251)-2'-O)-methyltransferase RlmB [Burkholderiales bacterium]|nr:23S rRNA (guanosine(2251)-2'-O)-methyltransferase RlmB [Burkholderiales bacterium]
MSSSYLYGFHTIIAALERPDEPLESIWYLKDREGDRIRNMIALAQSQGVKILSCTRHELDIMVPGASHQGVVGKIRASKILNFEAMIETLSPVSLFLVLDGIKDPHNLGACLRSANAFGVNAVIVPQDRSARMNSTVRKVACGAAELTPLVTVTNLSRTLATLSEEGVHIVGTAADSKLKLSEASLRGPLAIVMGGEEAGLRRLTKNRCDELVSIPMEGEVESLNVSVAAGVLLYECNRQRFYS